MGQLGLSDEDDALTLGKIFKQQAKFSQGIHIHEMTDGIGNANAFMVAFVNYLFDTRWKHRPLYQSRIARKESIKVD